MNKETKTLRIDELSAVFAAHQTIYLFDYTKMKVSQATALRKSLRKQGASLKVVKNRLALRSLAESMPADLRPAFSKPTAVAYTSADPIALAKTVKEFAVSTKAIALKGGLVEGIYFAPERFDEIVKLAPRPELLGKIAVMMASPLVKLLRTLQAPLAQTGVLLSQLKDKKSKETIA
ncbi:MAG: 50S ribosomal protein L10 [Acidobacteriota bacterium]|nr:50S ribosomal protein L10 [Acidobacteriota bacterium]